MPKKEQPRSIENLPLQELSESELREALGFPEPRNLDEEQTAIPSYVEDGICDRLGCQTPTTVKCPNCGAQYCFRHPSFAGTECEACGTYMYPEDVEDEDA